MLIATPVRTGCTAGRQRLSTHIASHEPRRTQRGAGSQPAAPQPRPAPAPAPQPRRPRARGGTRL